MLNPQTQKPADDDDDDDIEAETNSEKRREQERWKLRAEKEFSSPESKKMSAGLRLEGLINETLAGRNKKLSEMSGAVLDTIIDDSTRAGRLIQDTLLGLNNGSGGAPLEGAHLIPTSISVEMGQAERLFWVLIFSVMVLVAAGGNTIVVYIVATNREMKSVTNYFLVNLSLADTMVSTLNVIFNFISMLNR